MYFLIVATIANIALALAFILYLGWGVPGSAVALVIAQAISAILCLIYIYYRFPQLHLGTKDICLTKEEMWEHLRMGLPMAVVMDLGSRVTYSACVRPKIMLSTSTQLRLVSTPESMPSRMAFRLSLSSCSWRVVTELFPLADRSDLIDDE